MKYLVKVSEHKGNGWDDWLEKRYEMEMNWNDLINYLVQHVYIINHWNSHYGLLLIGTDNYEVNIYEIPNKDNKHKRNSNLMWELDNHIDNKHLIIELDKANKLEFIPYKFNDGHSGNKDKGYFHLEEESL